MDGRNGLMPSMFHENRRNESLLGGELVAGSEL